MSIQWFTPSTQLPTVTIASYGITFNSGCINLLANVSSIRLGCDATERTVYIELLRGGDSRGFSVPEITVDTRSVRITCREFVQFLQAKCKLDISSSAKFLVEEKSKNQLVVDLKALMNQPKLQKKRKKESVDG